MCRDDATVLDIISAARRVGEFVQGMEKSAFMEDVRTQSAVLHQMMVLGEAVRRLSEQFRSRHEHVPWSVIAAMRNKLIHEYDGVDLDEVWKTAERDIPQLLCFIESLPPFR